MKTRKLTLLLLTLLATLLIGAAVINVLWAPKTLKLKVQWKPVDYVLDNPIPDPWNAEIWFVGGEYEFDEIDPASLLLEGVYEPESDPYESETRPRLVVPFDGYDVLDIVLLKAGHMSVGEYRVWLEITGEVVDKKTQQRTPFEGKGGITLIIPENPPP